MSPEEMEEVYGRLWESNEVEDLNLYDRIRKVEPLERAMREQSATAWLSGLRRDQTSFRRTLSPLSHDAGRSKVLPILNWTSKDVYEYLEAHGLPYHPLFHKGYATVGDWHSSRPLEGGDTHERETRFSGLKEECGIHLPAQSGAPANLVAA
jgi:phosphoadenosine phosphosulfate reductase